jgi:hypothetical protein
LVLGIPGYTSERGGKSVVRNTRIHVGERREKWCLDYQDELQR